MDYPLSNGDIQDYLRKTKIIPYGNIKNYLSAADLVYPHNECVILYRTSDDDGNVSGHWTCLLKNKYGYEMFDSYGIMLDDELEFPVNHPNPEAFKIQHGQEYRYLTKLLSEVNCPVSYNHHKFQAFKLPDGTRPATCGRYVILRLLNKSKNLEQFKKEFDKTVKDNGYKNYDECVVHLINSLHF